MSTNYIREISPDNGANVFQIKDAEAAPISLLKDTVGWVGKNIIPIKISDVKTATGGTWSENSYTKNNVTFVCTVDDNDYVTNVAVSTSGNASADTYLNLLPQTSVDLFDSNKSYILNGNVDDVVDFSYQDSVSGWGNKCTDTGNGVVVNPRASKTKITLYLLVTNGTEIATTKNIKPMLRDASITDGTFEPYHKSVEDSKFDRAEQRVLGARNLMPYPYATASGTVSHDVTFTENDDKSIKANGTNSSQSVAAVFYLGVFMPNGVSDYTVCCDPTDDSVADKFLVRIGKRADASDTWGSYYGSVWNTNSISIPKNTVAEYGFALNVFVATAYTVSNKTIKPFIKLSKDTYNGYTEPCMTNKELTDAVTPDKTTFATVKGTASVNTIVKTGNIVVADLRTNGVTTEAWESIATIPAGYRPANNVWFVANDMTGGTLIRCALNSDGTVTCPSAISNKEIYIHAFWSII